MLPIFLILAAIPAAGTGVPEVRTSLVSEENAPRFVQRLFYEVPPGITGFWTPVHSDAAGIEAGLLTYLEKVRPEVAKWLRSENGKRLDGRWSWFRRQVIGVKKGTDRFLLVAYWCEDPAWTVRKAQEDKAKLGERYRPDSWKEHPLIGADGGYTWFRVLFALNRQEFVLYEANTHL